MVDLYFIALKRMLSDKVTRGILLGIFLLSIFLTFIIADNAGTKSSIPIGVINLDTGSKGEELVERIKAVPAFYVYEGTMYSLDKLLKEDLVQAVFIINKGYETDIKSGRTNDIVTLLYKENNRAVKVLSDIFAGEMLKDICLYKGFLSYEDAFLKNGELLIESGRADTIVQYEEYTEELGQNGDSFSFDIKVKDIETQRDIMGGLDNSLLYLQILSGILAMLLSLFGFYAALPLVMDLEVGIRNRMKIGGAKSRNLFVLDMCAVGAGSSLLLCFNLVICVCFYIFVPGLTIINIARLFILLLFYSIMAIIGCMIIGNLTGRVRRYESLGVAITLIFGLLGIGSTLSGIMNGDLLNISKLTPNSWFINRFIDIILNTGLQGTQYTRFINMGITGFSFLGILWLVDKSSLYNWRNIT